LATRDWLRRLLALSLHAAPEQISSATPFGMLGIDSAQAMAMTSRIGKYMGHALSPSVLYEHPTIDALALYLCSHGGRKARVLVQLQRGDAEQFPNLFCVHPVGGSAMAYLALVQKLPATLPVYAFENDGSDGNDGNESSEDSAVPFDDLVALAQYYVVQMQALQGSGPYWLLGYSFGGIVAFEMACQILASGGTIGGLFVIDAPAPLYQDHTPGPQIAAIETYDDFLNTAMLNHLIPDHLGDEERAKLRLRIEQNQAALARYRIAPTTGMTPGMTLLRASAEAAHLREATRHPAFDRPDFGWEEAAPGSVLAVVPVPGDHFSVMNEPTMLAQQLVAQLRQFSNERGQVATTAG
jgi:thioesterase domain-containing protein/aryl carrier-like protein